MDKMQKLYHTVGEKLNSSQLDLKGQQKYKNYDIAVNLIH